MRSRGRRDLTRLTFPKACLTSSKNSLTAAKINPFHPATDRSTCLCVFFAHYLAQGFSRGFPVSVACLLAKMHTLVRSAEKSLDLQQRERAAEGPPRAGRSAASAKGWDAVKEGYNCRDEMRKLCTCDRNIYIYIYIPAEISAKNDSPQRHRPLFYLKFYRRVEGK